jgi:hypothetical protein
MPDAATTITNRSKRPSKIELPATLRKIRHLLAEGYTNKEIIETLQLEHFRFPDIFLRQTKKAYISFVTPEILADIVALRKNKIDAIPSYNAIRLTLNQARITKRKF